MAAAVARAVEVPARPATPTSHHLTLNTSFGEKTTSLPNRHIPYCSPGPQPHLQHGLPSPPDSPPSASTDSRTNSLLYPPDSYSKIHDSPPVHAISAQTLADALRHAEAQSLPDPRLVFPWLHGLHGDNHMQLSFFNRFMRRRLPDIPLSLRGITIVKAGGNLRLSKLKGAISPDELLIPSAKCNDRHAAHCQGGPCFMDVDPLIGFSVRNFQIQACKMATISDIVVYGDDLTPRSEVEILAQLISQAQRTWKDKVDPGSTRKDDFNTFIVTDTFETFETNHSSIVASNSAGSMTGDVLDFLHQERLEMWTLSKPSEISKNVFLGPTLDPPDLGPKHDDMGQELPHFDVLIEASDFARMPEEETLKKIETFLDENVGSPAIANIDFPSSGSVGIQVDGDADIERLISMCKWIHKIVNSEADGDTDMELDDCDSYEAQGASRTSGRKIMIHCTDGYTESSLLALTYLMYTEGVPAHQAWLRMHREKGRNFFAYQADKSLLEYIEKRVMWESPSPSIDGSLTRIPLWAKRMDGSFPSRIRPHLYLGNLNHATNPGLLREIGITHILSVGEPIAWHNNPEAFEEDAASWPAENFLYIDGVQDNGIDPLTKDFDRCLGFIGKAKANGGATLVHCRVGVSRSATICIAEVMNELELSFPRAYCYVRARRLNVIIQPHLRFAYELLKWEELLCERRGVPVRREAEWATIAREIALMNKPYCRE